MKVLVSVFSALVLVGGVGSAQQSNPAQSALPDLQIKDCWVFYQSNIATPDLLQKATTLMKRAKGLGYTGMFLSDSKLEKFQLQDKKTYARNWQKFRQACNEQKMQLIVPVCSMGYMGEFLAEDPNLAEGMPVRGAEFVVKGGKLVPGDVPQVVNGSLTQWKGDAPVGWTVDKPGSVSFRDDQVKLSGKPSLRQEHGASKGPVRLSQKIQVKPWHAYHISVMAKTEDCTSKDFRVMALSGGAEKGRVLDWQPPPIKEAVDWTSSTSPSTAWRPAK